MSDAISLKKAETAWTYLVVSSDQQVETLVHQRSWAEQTAKSNGWKITAVFEGVSSGRDGVRSLLEKLLKRLNATAKLDRPTRVLLIRLDRLGRGLGLEAMAALAEITKFGVVLHTRQDGDYKISRASDSILPLMRIVTGAIENEARRDKMTAVFARKRAAGLVPATKRPYGLRLENGLDVPDGLQAETITRAFELAAHGFGLYYIGQEISKIAPKKIYRNGREHSVEWTPDRVAKLLRNEAYRTSLIPVDLWERVTILRSRTVTKQRTKHPWPLSGALTCECGRILIGSIRGATAQRAYRCTSKTSHGKIVTLSARKIEEAFVDMLSRLRTSSELDILFGKQVGDERSRASSMELETEKAGIELRSLSREMNRVWEMNRAGHLSDQYLQPELSRLQNEELKVKNRIDAIALEKKLAAQRNQERIVVRDLLEAAVSIWASAKVEQQQEMARSLARSFGGITVSLNGMIAPGGPCSITRFFQTTPWSSDERGSS